MFSIHRDINLIMLVAKETSSYSPSQILMSFLDGFFKEAKDGDENKEKPLVDVSEPAKVEEMTTVEAKPATEPAVPAEVEPTEAKAEAVEEAKEPPKEDKKEVAETVATA